MSSGSDSERMLRELYDREQIRQIKYRNMRHLDLKQWDEMAETFTKDATTAWLDGQISLSGRDAIMDFLRGTPFADGDSVITVHQCAAMEIDFVTPDHAKASSRLYNPMWFRGDDQLHLLLAFYHDEFRRVDDEWKISHSGHEYIYDDTFTRSDLPSHEVLYSHPFGS
ncbi:MAG: nuclear transport factor 2 family protein [Myxococcales bacterium]|nr:nuclear transport factor 2 family protein [Myxococcales bacterium]